MRILECWFCGHPIYPGHGIMFVRNDAKTLNFCRGKCRKAYVHHRNPRRTRWTKAYRRLSGKEMVIDKSLEFIKQRNRPLKYNRERMATVLQHIQRVQEIQKRRATAFYQQRMQTARTQQLAAAKMFLRRRARMVERARSAVKISQTEPQPKSQTREVIPESK